jgi:hypothetical protein
VSISSKGQLFVHLMDNEEGILLYSKSALKVSSLKVDDVSIPVKPKSRPKKKSIYERYPIQTISYKVLLKEQSLLNPNVYQNEPYPGSPIGKVEKNKRKRKNRTRKSRKERK